MTEIWRDIKDYEGLYQVSNWGRVKSLGRYVNRGKDKYLIKERILKPSPTKGYNKVVLRCMNISKTHYIHRLVAIAFIPNPESFPQINHKDENPLNNHVDNLEWCNQKYNNNYGTHNIRMINTKRNRFLYSSLNKKK